MKRKSSIAVFVIITVLFSLIPVWAEPMDESDEIEAGRDYVENEAVFSANSLEEAEEVAESYGARLSSWME